MADDPTKSLQLFHPQCKNIVIRISIKIEWFVARGTPQNYKSLSATSLRINKIRTLPLSYPAVVKKNSFKIRGSAS